MASISTLLVLLMLVFNSYARSLNSNDVPARPKNFSTRILPLRAATFGRATLSNAVEEVIVVNAKKKSKPMPLSSTFESAIPNLSKQTKTLLPAPVIKSNAHVRGNDQQKNEISFQRRERPGKHAITPDQVKGKTEKVRDEITTTEGSTSVPTEASVVTTTTKASVDTTTTKASVDTTTTKASVVTTTTKASVVTTTTTEDPWEAFCNQACGTGDGGPECRCAGHPVG